MNDCDNINSLLNVFIQRDLFECIKYCVELSEKNEIVLLNGFLKSIISNWNLLNYDVLEYVAQCIEFIDDLENNLENNEQIDFEHKFNSIRLQLKDIATIIRNEV